jgi:hypothetical protein
VAARNRNPSVDPHQGVVDAQAMIQFVANANFDCTSEQLDFGRFLILNLCHDLLNEAKDALRPKPAMEVVNG